MQTLVVGAVAVVAGLVGAVIGGMIVADRVETVINSRVQAILDEIRQETKSTASGIRKELEEAFAAEAPKILKKGVKSLLEGTLK